VVGFIDNVDGATDIRQVVIDQLGQHAAMSRESLMLATGMEGSLLTQEMDALERAGEIETLRPMYASRRGVDAPSTKCSFVHYRLLRASDSDFLWEQDLNGLSSSGRIRNVAAYAGSSQRPSLLTRRSR
jgi:hypothetical protein